MVSNLFVLFQKITQQRTRIVFITIIKHDDFLLKYRM